jgi:hypothetical protein
MMAADLTPGTRVRVVAGPWPERIDCEGQIAQPPADYGDVYPIAGLGQSEVVVVLDADPLGSDHDGWWTCVYFTNSIEVVDGD